MKILKLLASVVLFTQAAHAQINVVAEVDHVKPDGVDVTGNFVLDVSGGTGSYTYEWQPGSFTAKNYTNIAIGTYTVKVKDTTPDSVYYYYNMGYKARWKNNYGCVIRTDSVYPDFVLPGWATAVSVNTLKAGFDGWLEYVIKTTTSYEMVGFTHGLTSAPGTFFDLDFSLYNNGGYLYFYELGGLYFAGFCQPGDVLHIERNDTMLYYYKNSVNIGTTIVPLSMRSNDWKILSVVDNEALTNMGCSFTDSTNSNFPGYTQDIPFITHCRPGFSNGSISLSPRVSGAQSYSWTPGSYTTAAISGQAPGTYTVAAKNSNAIESDYAYNIGYKTHWKNLFYSALSRDSLYPLGSPTGWNTALSVNTLKPGADGWMEYVLKTNTSYEMLGFTDSVSVISGLFTDLDYGLYHSANLLYFVEGGIGGIGSYCRNGDIIRIERIDTIVNYFINGIPMRSLVTDPATRNKDWKVKVMTDNEDMDNVGLSFFDSTLAVFPNYLRVYPTFGPESDLGTYDGSIGLSPLSTGGPPYTYLWLPDSTATSLCGNIDVGTYTVTVMDVDSNQTIYNYDMGFRYNLTDTSGLYVYTDSVYAYGGTWGTGLCIDSLLPDQDGWEAFVVDSTVSLFRMLGFIDSTYTPADVIDMRYGIYQFGNTVYDILDGIYYAAATCFRGDILKIEKTDTLINCRLNGSIIGSTTIPPYARSRSLRPKMAVSSGNYLARGVISIPPLLAPPPSYLVLHKTLDGGYYQTSNNYLYFKFVEEYTKQTTNLSYKIYKDNRVLYTGSLPTMTEVIGDNRFQLNLVTAGLSINTFYILEVTNEKSEKWLARFKY